MEITEIRVQLADSPADRLRAYCTITFDSCFVVRDIRIVEGKDGFFVAMPSRRVSVPCKACGQKNYFGAHYCNACGKRIERAALPIESGEGVRYYADVAHPINAECRDHIHKAILRAFFAELDKQKNQGVQ
jgi:stage V sporulation protein G